LGDVTTPAPVKDAVQAGTGGGPAGPAAPGDPDAPSGGGGSVEEEHKTNNAA